MAVSINSRQAISHLLRQSFKQCVSFRRPLNTRSSINQTRRLHSQTQSQAKHASLSSDTSDGSFIPFITDPTTPSTQQAQTSQSVPWNVRPSANSHSFDAINPQISLKKPQNLTQTSSKSSSEDVRHPKTVSKRLPKDATRDISKAKADGRRGPKNTDVKTKIKSASSPSIKASNPIPTKAAKSRRMPDWGIQKDALEKKFGAQSWNPAKKLSPDALEGIRALHAQYPDHFTTPVLADQFKISPEAIRRILKSKWKPTSSEEEDRAERWERRGERVWAQLVEKHALHPPKKWRQKGIGRGIPRQSSGQLDKKWIAKNSVASSNTARDPRPAHVRSRE